jgi:Uma2 family endonuclease
MDDMLAPLERPRRRFTVDEYYRMADAGILKPDDRVELIEGEIIEMAPIGIRHARCVAEFNQRLVIAAGDRAVLWPQNPVRLPRDTEPQPDVVLIRPPSTRYDRPPRPDDVFLLIEVADTSVRYDREVKLPLYARAGVREVWLADLTHDVVLVHRQPGPDGYASALRVGPGGTLTPERFPDIVLTVDDALLAR